MTRRKLNARKKNTRRVAKNGGMLRTLSKGSLSIAKDITSAVAKSAVENQIKSKKYSNAFNARESFGTEGENKYKPYTSENSENYNLNIVNMQTPMDEFKNIKSYQPPVVQMKPSVVPNKPSVVPNKPLRM